MAEMYEVLCFDRSLKILDLKSYKAIDLQSVS